ncbi:MAG: PfkB family carbohydrate kinase [Desulfobacterales bacterium]|jgi:sugar/nucleoside kinase (ribokinase family)
MSDVICMGEILVEHVSTADNVSLVHSPGFIKAPGGAPANVAVALQRLGLRAGFVGKVGRDPFGEYLRESIAQTGVDTTYLFVDEKVRTTAVYVAVWDDGRKDLCFYRNPGADMMLTADEISDSIFKGARCFHFGSISFIDEPSASAQKKALQIAQDKGLMISYDPNYRPTLWPDRQTAEKIIQDSFRHCHLAKVSEEEWQVATGYDDLEDGIHAIMSKGVELLVISRGENGAIATNGDYRIELPGLEVDVIETTGAGDGFLGAILTELLPEREKTGSLATLSEEKVRNALKIANAVGALTCKKPGAIPALPTRAETEKFISMLAG